MTAVDSVLVVGGGPAGTSTAICLKRRGISVEIIERKPEWTALGSGLTMVGATLRALKTIGLADRCVELGAGGDEFGLYDPSLELRVEGPSAAIIQHRAPDILDRVNLFLGAGAVVKLRIVQGPLRGVVKRGGPAPGGARRRPRPPLDAAAEQALAAGLEKFPEGPLKTALTRLGREVMRDAPSEV